MSDTATSKVVTSAGDKRCAECGEVLAARDKRYARCKPCRTGGDEAEKTPTVPSVSSVMAGSQLEPVVLDIERVPDAPSIPRETYWCGSTDDCPQAVALAGKEFPAWSGRVVGGDGKARSKLVDRTDRGVLHKLTEADVALIIERMNDRVVRGDRIITKSSRRTYRKMPGDRPLGQFVYMARVVGEGSVDRMGQTPPTMIPRD